MSNRPPKGWKTFLRGLEANDADLIEMGLQEMAHQARKA